MNWFASTVTAAMYAGGSITLRPVTETTARVDESIAGAAKRLGDRMEAQWLLMHVLQCNQAWLFAHAEHALPPRQVADFQELVQRRQAGEPLAYLIGWCGFWSLDLQVSPATLIPRVETETLVEAALTRLPGDVACTVADLGTGSGAVALALASERPLARITAIDASEQALRVARGNGQRLGLDRVEWRHGDWLAPLAGRRLDAIVSNPPYIAEGDAHLEQGDLRHEPAMALASGRDGLDAIRIIVAGARAHLLEGGWLLLEHGCDQGEAVRALLAHDFGKVDTVRDLEGRERVTGGQWRPGAARS